MSNDEKKFQPIFQILHINSAWFLLELAMALVTTIGMRFLQVWEVIKSCHHHSVHKNPVHTMELEERFELTWQYCIFCKGYEL